jgi:radical SAM protein with 4Fe4S-binding SPASM domain
MLSKNIQVYLKTTETCNLNCKHCFTSGSKGAKIFFNPDKTIDFLYRLKRDKPDINGVRILFHGGEPMLAPARDILKIIDIMDGAFQDTSFGIQTNLTYRINDERMKVFDRLKPYGIGASWDYDIRFSNETQKQLFEANSMMLSSRGHDMTLAVCMSEKLIKECEPKEIMKYAKDLGYKHILFERITGHGNAVDNPGIKPSNKDQDTWMEQMWDDYISLGGSSYIHNMLMEEVAEAVVNREHIGNRCRDCEQSLITINADGTLAGCPNTAPKDYWGSIDQSINDNLRSKKRLKTIACEVSRDPRCINCPVFDVCNGDCHQLEWEGDICGAPKSLMKKLKSESSWKLKEIEKAMFNVERLEN